MKHFRLTQSLPYYKVHLNDEVMNTDVLAFQSDTLALVGQTQTSVRRLKIANVNFTGFATRAASRAKI
jgi:hypothetical protein